MKKIFIGLMSLTLMSSVFAVAPKSDAEIANMVMTANTEEMNLAKLAKDMSHNKKVKDFAESMITDHGANNEKTQMLVQKEKIGLKESQPSEKFKYMNEVQYEKLKTLKGKEFDSQYITTQVEVHKKVLNDLDNNLIPNARNKELKAMLQSTRKKVEAHIKEAEAIKGSLQ